MTARERATPKGGRVPRVSIGLAVYNGERFLRQSIESLLGQTFTDFELIISDNASTDATAEICREYAERDGRIRYSRNASNIGGVNNENLTFTLARGEYFRWAAHDDVCAPTLLERCVEVLDHEPDVVLCFTAMTAIDEDGRESGVRFGREGTAARPSTRFSQLSYRWHPCDATYGLVRSSVLRETGLQKNYTASDRVLLCELAFRGRFVQLPEPLFYKRFHDGNRYRDWRGRMAWFMPDLAKTGKVTFPNWLEISDYIAMVWRVRISPVERALCHLSLARWLVLHAKGLAWDVVVAGYMTLHSRKWRAQRYADVQRWL
jgi:glycosyltransferase involved in cell wall biosynthesis